MVTLRACPGCGSGRWSGVPIRTDLRAKDVARWGDAVIGEPRFALCHRCGLLFARARQAASTSDAYYAAFQTLEHRDYAVYPPPQLFLDNQAKYAEALGAVLDGHGVFRPGQRVLQIRSECGLHLARLRRRWGLTELYALDHFDSNIRYAREDLGLPHVQRLSPTMEIPFAGPFDVILCNHALTHALDPAAVLARLRALLADDGVIVFYGEDSHEGFLRRGWPLPRVNNYHKQLLTKTSLEHLGRLHGFDTRVVHTFKERIPWAVPKRAMVAIGRRAPALTPDALPPFRYRSDLWTMRWARVKASAVSAFSQPEKRRRRDLEVR
jgi:SAM-dependent methyltransferase